MEKRKTLAGTARALAGAALALLLAALLAIAVCALCLRAQLDLDGTYEEQIRFYGERIVQNVFLTLLALAVLLGLRRLLDRFARVRLSAVMMALWMAAALFWVLGIGLLQECDCRVVMDAAKDFAQDDFTPLSQGYLRAYPFQLGMALVMETLMRLFPGIDVNLVMQSCNTVYSVSAAGFLAAAAERAFGEGDGAVRRAALLLYAGFLPFLLFNVYVYGTLPMLCWCSLAILCMTCYLRAGERRPARLLAVAAVALALGYGFKSNALIVYASLGVCAALHAMRRRDLRPLLAVCAALLMGLALSKLIIWQYEARAGFPLNPNVSKLSWLTMGLGDTASMPGWYNGYVGHFTEMNLTAEEQSAVARADLVKRIGVLLSDPAYLAAFMRDKLLSQWLEPTYSTIWYGYRSEWSGHFNGLAVLLYREGNLLNALAVGYMNVYQQAVYLLACVGVAGCFARRQNAEVMILPVTLLGGMLFHQLFEAKSQYIYVYAIYMMPLAAYGLVLLGRVVSACLRRARGTDKRGAHATFSLSKRSSG